MDRGVTANPAVCSKPPLSAGAGLVAKLQQLAEYVLAGRDIYGGSAVNALSIRFPGVSLE
jgi:hypothetical protein